MSYLFSSKELYNKGLNYFRSKDYKSARTFFSGVNQNSPYKDTANAMLVRVDIKEGRYVDALNRVNESLGSSTEGLLLEALINELQYNYSKSLDLLQEASYDKRFYYSAKLKEAQVHLEYGYFSMFLKEIQNFKNTSLYNKSLFLKSMYLIITRDYKNALEVLKKTDKKNMRYDQAIIFEKANFLTRYFLNRVSENDHVSGELEYFKSILFDDSNDFLLSHIKDNYSKDSLYTSLVFSPDIDFEMLLNEARNRMSYMNPVFHNFEAVYRMILPTSIATINDREVNGLAVKTIIGTDKIVGISPFECTSDFDSEMESTNDSLHKTLLLK